MIRHAFGDRADLDAALAAWIDRVVGSAAGGFVALAVGASTLPAYRRLAPLPAGLTVVTLDELDPAPARQDRAFAAQLRASLPPSWAAALRPFTPAAWGVDRVASLGPAVDAAIAGRLVAAVCGLGPDGHVAFNQPPDDGHSPSRAVALAPANLARLGAVAPAEGAFTLGLGSLRAAGHLALVAAGAGKETALARVLDGPAGPDCPASWLAGHPRLEVFRVPWSDPAPTPPN